MLIAENAIRSVAVAGEKRVKWLDMNALEFTTELSPLPVLPIPQEIADQLPKSGRARVIVVPIPASDDDGEIQWRAGAYEQFLRDDVPEDGIYDNY